MIGHSNSMQLMQNNPYENMVSKGIAVHIMQTVMKSLSISMEQPALQTFATTAQLMESKNEDCIPLILQTISRIGIPLTDANISYIKREYARSTKNLQIYQTLQLQKQQLSSMTVMEKIKNFPFQTYVELMSDIYENRTIAEAELKSTNPAFARLLLPTQSSSLPVDTIKKLWEEGKNLIQVGNRMEAMNSLHKALILWIENQPRLMLTKKNMALNLLAQGPVVITGLLNVGIHSLFKVDIDKKDLYLFVQIVATHAINLLELVKYEFQHDATFFHFVYNCCIDWLKISARIIKKFNIETDEPLLALLYKKQLESEFIYAVMQRDFNAVQNLLLADPTLPKSIYGYNGQTPVMAAIIAPGIVNIPLIQLLIDHGADLLAKSKARNGYGFTALHYAVSKESIPAMQFLVKAEPKLLNTASAQGVQPLVYAISVGDKKAIDALVKLGAPYQEYLFSAKKMNIPADIVQLLKKLSQKAANRNYKRYSEQLMREEKSVKPSARDFPQKKDAQPWQTALDQGNYYFENERYKEAVVAFTETLTIFEKIHKKPSSSIKRLAEHYTLYRFQGLAALKSADYSRALSSFTAAEKIKKQIDSLPHPCAVAEIPALEDVAFLHAAASGNAEEAETILDDYQGITGTYHIINAPGQNDLTPLMIVAEKQDELYFVFQRFLVETVGADLNATDIQGRTVLHQSAIQNRLDNIAYFLAQNGRIAINQCDGYGRTALHYAVESGFVEVVVELLRNNAKTDALDHDKKYALDLCNDKKIKQLFLELKSKELEQKEVMNSESIVNEVFELFKNGLVPGTKQYFKYSDKISRTEKILSRKVEPNSTDIEAILRLSEFYRHTKMVLKQRALVFDALNRFPNHVKLLLDAAYLEKFVGNHISAKIYFRKVQGLLSSLAARDQQQTNLLIAALMGQIKLYFVEKCYHLIIRCCNQILKLQPNHAQAITHLASVHMLFNQPELANTLIARITDKQNSYVQLALMQFQTYTSEHLQAINTGKALLQTVLKKNIKRLVFSLLAQCYEALKENTEANKYYKMLLKEFPEDFHVKMRFLIFNCKTNKTHRKIATEAAKKMAMQFPYEQAYLNYARELWYAKQYFASIEWYEKTAKLFPQSIRVHVELIQSYVAHEFIDRAIFHAEHFLGIFNHADKIDLNAGRAEQILFLDNPNLQFAYINALFANSEIDKATQYSLSCLTFHRERHWVIEEIENILYQNNITPPSNVDENESKYESEDFSTLPNQPGNEDTGNTLLVSQPDTLVTPNGIISYFLNGNAEKTYQHLVESKLETTLFPEVLRTQLTQDEIASNRDWVSMQFHNIDLRVRKGRPVSSNEIYFILLSKEIYPWVKQVDKTHNVFAMALQVAERYKFQCDELGVLPSDSQGLGLMGYVYSRANYKPQPSPKPQPTIDIKLSLQPTSLWVSATAANSDQQIASAQVASSPDPKTNLLLL
ncbi:MAG: ankyrin repeat domain-containing protein [Gammaproteobacteria bacterium]